MIIYKTTNLLNNKIYIGQDSKNNKYYMGSGKLITQAIKKYGRENFIKEILCECASKEELNQKEIYWINELNATNRKIGYNITKGGEGARNFGNKNGAWGKSPKQRLIEKYGKEIGLQKYEKFCLRQTEKLKSNNPMKGKNWQDMWREKYKDAAEGMIQEVLQNVANKCKGPNPKKGSPGKKNPMHGRSVYDVWLVKFGKEIADQKLEAFKQKCRDRYTKPIMN